MWLVQHVHAGANPYTRLRPHLSTSSCHNSLPQVASCQAQAHTALLPFAQTPISNRMAYPTQSRPRASFAAPRRAAVLWPVISVPRISTWLLSCYGAPALAASWMYMCGYALTLDQLEERTDEIKIQVYPCNDTPCTMDCHHFMTPSVRAQYKQTSEALLMSAPKSIPWVHVQTHVCRCTCTCPCMQARTCTHAHTHMHMHAHTQAITHARTIACMHGHTHACRSTKRRSASVKNVLRRRRGFTPKTMRNCKVMWLNLQLDTRMCVWHDATCGRVADRVVEES